MGSKEVSNLSAGAMIGRAVWAVGVGAALGFAADRVINNSHSNNSSVRQGQEAPVGVLPESRIRISAPGSNLKKI